MKKFRLLHAAEEPDHVSTAIMALVVAAIIALVAAYGFDAGVTKMRLVSGYDIGPVQASMTMAPSH